MKETFEASGPLASVDVLAALCAVGRGAVSGTFRATGPGGAALRFGFDDGALVALDPPPEIAPAEVLIRAGKVQRATYEALTVGDFEDRFAVAAASGVISRREINWGLKISAIESLSRALSWGEGAYAFEEGPPEPTAPPLRLPVDQWILELFLRSNDRAFVVRHIGPTDIPVARTAGFAEAFAALGLTADADAVVEGIDGRRTIEQVVKRSRADEFATLKLLGAMIVLGLVRPIHEMPAEAAPEPAPGPTRAEPAEPEWSLDEPATAAPAAEAPMEPEEPSVDFAGPPESAAERPAEPEEIVAEDEARFELEGPAPEAPVEEPAGEEPMAPGAEEAEPSGPAILPAPEISVPLFALTAPEPDERPEPDAGFPAPPPEESSPHRRLGTIRAAVVLAVAAAIAGALLLRRRPAPPPPAPVPSPSRTAAERPAGPPAGTAPPPKLAARPEPAPAPPTAPPSLPPPAAGAARKGEPARPAPRRAASSSPAGGASAETSWDKLARAGRKAFERPGPNRYAIQLELACEEATLRKAFDADPGRRRIWLAPYSFRGRSCYRVLWGKYRDLASAKAAKSTVPAIFSLDGNRPAVVPLGRAK